MVTNEEFGGGTALSFALISVESLPASVDFYCNRLGLSQIESVDGDFFLADDALEARAARAALLYEDHLRVGGLLLVEYHHKGKRIRQQGDRTTRGLWNINFYVTDIDAASSDFEKDGFYCWTKPITYEVGPEAGVAREVLIEGPDGVAINLVQPMGGAHTFTGRIRAEIEQHGMTDAGYTPIATTAHCLHDIDAAKSFYADVLGMQVVLDEILGKPETNKLLSRPPNAQARTVFVAGNHFFGKIALNQPLNYPVAERVNAAKAPNIGYLSQGFAIKSLDRTAVDLKRVGIEYTRRKAPNMKEFGSEQVIQLRIPGSGSFALLYESG